MRLKIHDPRLSVAVYVMQGHVYTSGCCDLFHGNLNNVLSFVFIHLCEFALLRAYHVAS
jgi:hypothetical protein